MPKFEQLHRNRSRTRSPQMRILIVSFTFPPNKDGVSEAAAAITKGFCEKGWEVEILTEASPEREGAAKTWNGAQIHEYQENESKELMMSGSGEGGFAHFLRDGNWDLLIFQAYSTPLQKALPILDKIAGKKVLVSHGFPGLVWEFVPRFPFGLTWMLRRTLRAFRLIKWHRKFDRVVFLSEQADLKGFYDHWLAKVSGYPGRVIIPNGVNLSERGSDPAGFRRDHRIPDDAFVFLCVANYSPRKNQAYAVRAFRKADIPNSYLVLIGSELNAHSERFIESDAEFARLDGGKHVIWLEKQTRGQTLDAYAACQAFVLSAYHEAQPFVLLEAMREGKPWIARRSGCIEIMEGGLCVTSVGKMANAMRSLASTPSEVARLSKEGLAAMAANYNRETYVRRYCELAKELCPENPRGGSPQS
jgi:glycosyltransferase involved in cell wall biosynthesis